MEWKPIRCEDFPLFLFNVVTAFCYSRSIAIGQLRQIFQLYSVLLVFRRVVPLLAQVE